jgi:hypothetical protein
MALARGDVRIANGTPHRGTVTHGTNCELRDRAPPGGCTSAGGLAGDGLSTESRRVRGFLASFALQYRALAASVFATQEIRNGRGVGFLQAIGAVRRKQLRLFWMVMLVSMLTGPLGLIVVPILAFSTAPAFPVAILENTTLFVAIKRGGALAKGSQGRIAVLEHGELTNYYLAHSARADMYRRLGRTAEARSSYEKALALTQQEPERQFLQERIRQLK